MVQKQPGDSPPPVMFFHIQRTNIGSQVATAVIIMIDQADTCHDLPFFLLHDIPLGDSGLLPDSLRNALGIAIYGMFIAIIIPPACKAKPIAMVVLLATVLSCCFKWLPILNQISSGWVIIICAVVVSAYAAARYPIDDEPAPEKAGGTG